MRRGSRRSKKLGSRRLKISQSPKSRKWRNVSFWPDLKKKSFQFPIIYICGYFVLTGVNSAGRSISSFFKDKVGF